MGRFLQPQRGGCGEQGGQQGRVNLGIWGELQGEIRKRFGVSLVLRGVTKAPAGWVSKAPTLASAHYSKEIPWSNILERRKPEHYPQQTHWPPAEKYHPVQGQVVLLPWEPWAFPPPESTFLTGIRKRHEVGVDRLLHAGPGLN